MNYQIEVGDIVHVDINAAQVTIFSRAEVLGMPQGPGDSWRFRDMQNPERVVYVSEGCTVTLVEKTSKDGPF